MRVLERVKEKVRVREGKGVGESEGDRQAKY